MADLTKKELDDLDLDTFDELDSAIDLGDSELELSNSQDNVSSEVQTNTEDKEDKELPEETTEESTTASKQEKSDLILYMITDKHIDGMLSYFRNYGVNISQIFSNILEARDTLLMQVEPTRLLVVDTGTGKFTNMAARKALIDLLGICDEDTKISVFYTDTVIKYEVANSVEVEDKKIDWFKYRSSADLLANVLQHMRKENYVYDTEQKQEINSINSLDITGLPVKVTNETNIGSPILVMQEIINNMTNNIAEGHEIPGYEIKI